MIHNRSFFYLDRILHICITNITQTTIAIVIKVLGTTHKYNNIKP